MRILSRKVIFDYIKTHPGLKDELMQWYRQVEQSKWASVDDIKKNFINFDYISVDFMDKRNIIFNIMDNKVKIYVKAAFNTGIVFIK